MIVDAGGIGGAPGIDALSRDVRTVTSRFETIVIGRAHACGSRTDHTIECIGDNSKGQATPPPGMYWGVAAAGDDFTCASQIDTFDLDKNGQVVCWGDNTYGQTSVPPGIKGVVAGPRHACGWGLAGPSDSMVCWGDVTSGQDKPPPGMLVDVVAGRNHTCALKPDDPTSNQASPVCWGDNSRGQSTPPPVKIGHRGAHWMSAGGDHTCVTDLIRTYCWGDNSGDQSRPPVGSIASLAVAPGHACGIDYSTYKILCWGQDWGDATPVPPSGEFSNLWAGQYRTCAQPADQTQPVVCWGSSYELWY